MCVLMVQHGGGACGGLFIALEEQLRAFCALPSVSSSSSSLSVCPSGVGAAAGPPCVPSPPPSPRAPSSASPSSSSSKGLGDLCYSFVSYDQLPQQPCRDQGAGECGVSLLQHVLCVYGPPDTKPPLPHSLGLASAWMRDEASLGRLRATLESLLDQHTSVLPVKVAPEVGPLQDPTPALASPPSDAPPLPVSLMLGLPGW